MSKREVRADPYPALSEAIATGRFLPGERLVEEDLAATFATNRANIRTALLRLEQDGAIVRERNRGARVRALTIEEAHEILDARAALEKLVAGRAAERAQAADIASLQTALREMDAALAAGNRVRYTELNGAFHGLLIRIARHATAARMLAQLPSQTVRSQYRAVFVPGRAEASAREHAAIVRAIVAGDAAAAEAAMGEHLHMVGAVIDDLAAFGLHR